MLHGVILAMYGNGHEFEPGIEIGTDTSWHSFQLNANARPTKPGHSSQSLDAMSLHSICHSPFCALVFGCIWGLGVEINKKSLRERCFKDFLFFLRIRTGLATTQRPLSVEITSTEVAEKQEDLGKFLRSCLGASPSPNEMYPQVHLPPPKTNMTGWKITFFFQ